MDSSIIKRGCFFFSFDFKYFIFYYCITCMMLWQRSPCFWLLNLCHALGEAGRRACGVVGILAIGIFLE